MEIKNMNNEFNFFIYNTPSSRPADYCLGCLEGSGFIDFDNYENDRICLRRISFDGYGCCNLTDQPIPLNKDDSQAFKEIIETKLSNQTLLTIIIKKTILSNRKLIWEDAICEYGLI